jgi:hypothetical protein
MSKNLDKYLKFWRKLNQRLAKGSDDAQCRLIREEIDLLWLKLTPEEVSESNRILAVEFADDFREEPVGEKEEH